MSKKTNKTTAKKNEPVKAAPMTEEAKVAKVEEQKPVAKAGEIKAAPMTEETKPAAKTAAKAEKPVKAASTPATFDAIWKMVEQTAKDYKKPAPDYFLAVQVNLTGDNGGTFYIALRNGNIDVAPYDYHDRSCGITISPEDFLKLMDGKLDAVAAFMTGKLKIDGSKEKALEFSKIVKDNKK